MRSSAIALTFTTLLTAAGCASSTSDATFSKSFWDPFGIERLFVADQTPIRVAVVTDGRTAWDVRAWWDIRSRTPWTDLREELSKYTGRPVQIAQLKLFQVAAHLETGRVDFALLSDTQLEQLKRFHDRFEVIAEAHPVNRTGLIVAKATSDIDSIKDIAGHRFAFGPRGDPVLHFGAAAKMESHGVSLDRVQHELLPFNALQYHISSIETAKEIAYGTTPVGVIDHLDFDRFPETGGKLFPLGFSKDQFRVLGQTNPVVFGPFVASQHADPSIVQSVGDFLVSANTHEPRVTQSLGVTAFADLRPNHQMPDGDSLPAVIQTGLTDTDFSSDIDNDDTDYNNMDPSEMDPDQQ